MDKVNDKKIDKENRLLNTAFKLFTEKGIKDTSIQNIVDEADVGKGTFYLYFKDKYQLRDVLITRKSQKLFDDALKALNKNYIENFSDQIIFIINYVIDELSRNQLLLKLIAKNLSLGVYNETIQKISLTNSQTAESSMRDLFIKGVQKNNIQLENPDVTLYIIIELVSSTCFNSILYKDPLPINEFKPHLYSVIRGLIEK